MTPANKPQNDLKRIEYLLLSIQANPGRSQRWHLRRLHMYVHGRADYHNGGTNCAYFNSPSYRNVLWTDIAPKNIEYHCHHPVDGFAPGGVGMKPSCSQMHLTRSGWNRANQARQKIGLEPRCWSTYSLPNSGACKIYQTSV